MGLCFRVTCSTLVMSFCSAALPRFDLSDFFSFFPLGEDRCSNGYETFGYLVYRVVEKAILVVFFYCPLFTTSSLLYLNDDVVVLLFRIFSFLFVRKQRVRMRRNSKGSDRIPLRALEIVSSRNLHQIFFGLAPTCTSRT